MHVFVLLLWVGGDLKSSDMYFYDLERCNWFASKLVKRYGNYSYRHNIPKDMRATAYCEPRYVNTETFTQEIY